MQPTRRSFLKSTTAGAIALGGAPAILCAAQAATKAGQRYTVALIGTGWWGGNILRAALADGRVKVVGLCDPDQSQLQRSAQEVEKLSGDTPRHYGDYRELLEKEKPQLVIIATPDHWHALITIAAVKSGAQVYVEKPISHTILEGVAMVKAARDADRVVQVGTHRRLSPHYISARQFIRSGKAGKIGMAKCFVYGGGGVDKPQANEEPPAGLDWDMWCGPAPLRPFNRKIHPMGHRQFLDYANGQIADWGIHWFDQVLWILEREHPTKVFSTGGRSIRGAVVNSPEGQTSDAPDHQVATYDFDDDFTLTWEHRQFAGNRASQHHDVGVHFYGSEGTFYLGWRDGWTFYPSNRKQAAVHEEPQFSGQKDSENIAESWRDFLEAIEEKRRATSDIETAQRSTNLSLLGMLSLKLGRSVQWDGAKQTIPDDPEAAALLKRPYRAPWEYPAESD